jgi:hypothetical protein
MWVIAPQRLTTPSVYLYGKVNSKARVNKTFTETATARKEVYTAIQSVILLFVMVSHSFAAPLNLPSHCP